MSAGIDETHDVGLRSWVASANGHTDFPVQNLPLGIFVPGTGAPRPGVAIGDMILDLPALLSTGLLGISPDIAEALTHLTLNRFLSLGAGPRRALRARLSSLLRVGAPEWQRVETCLQPATSCSMRLPNAIGDYTDFYVGIHHAENVGRQFRPDNPLLPNYKWVPIGYHGRASSVRTSGMPLRRPSGQTKAPDAAAPTFGPSKRLDYELELGIWIGSGNESGSTIPIREASEHVAGFCLLNDWSARDIQAWEYQPLGPFLSKNFATTISPWVITPEALAPFRTAQPARSDGDPTPLPYLLDERDQREGALAIELDVSLVTPGLAQSGMPGHQLSLSNTLHMYWTAAQLVTHHASNGCDLRPGDLLGTGTISGPERSACGSLLETTIGGREPIQLSSGERRSFLEDGDEVVLRARCRRDGFAEIGFGDCRGRVGPAV